MKLWDIVKNIGKDRVSRSLMITKPEYAYGDEYESIISERISEELSKPEFAGWKLWDDGLGTQQKGTSHRAVLVKYV